jgi:predicted porin
VLPVQQRYNIANDQDTDAWYAMLGYDVSSALNVSVRYATVDQGKAAGDKDSDEWVVQADYKYNKKLSFEVYYSMLDYDNGNNDNNEFLFDALYKF